VRVELFPLLTRDPELPPLFATGAGAEPSDFACSVTASSAGGFGLAFSAAASLCGFSAVFFAVLAHLSAGILPDGFPLSCEPSSSSTGAAVKRMLGWYLAA
jgi:hypothetical protein